LQNYWTKHPFVNQHTILKQSKCKINLAEVKINWTVFRSQLLWYWCTLANYTEDSQYFWYEKTKLVPTVNSVWSKTGRRWRHNLQSNCNSSNNSRLNYRKTSSRIRKETNLP
jgi:hypothetical protein